MGLAKGCSPGQGLGKQNSVYISVAVLQTSLRHVPCFRCARLREEAHEPPTAPSPACPFCCKRDKMAATGTLPVWHGATVYRCSRCRAEWAVSTQIAALTTDNQAI